MGNNSTDNKKIVELILFLENKYNLLKWEIEGVLVWQTARTTIYTSLLNLKISNNSILNKMNYSEIIEIYFRRIIVNSIFCNPFLDFTKSEVLVFESGRKYQIEDTYKDIYTKYLCEELEKENISYNKYETSYLVDKLAPRHFKFKHLDFIYIASKLISKFLLVKLNANEINKLKKIESEINLILGVQIDLKKIFTNEIKRFKSQYPLYKWLFKIKKAKYIYLTNYSDKSALIKAAKDCNIVVNELQHGLIAKEGLMANFPNTIEDSLEYFPHKFFIWKDLDMFTSKLPLSKENIVGFSNKHLDYMLEKNNNNIKNKRQILIISQPYDSYNILKYIMGNIQDLHDWKIIYKIHPAENAEYFDNSSIFEFSKYNNIKFVKNNVSIYKLFSESEYVLGVFSTAVFEAPYFGCKILLLNLSGVEMAYSLIESGKARLVNVDEKLLQFIR
jgi:hypothetical protein